MQMRTNKLVRERILISSFSKTDRKRIYNIHGPVNSSCSQSPEATDSDTWKNCYHTDRAAVKFLDNFLIKSDCVAVPTKSSAVITYLYTGECWSSNVDICLYFSIYKSNFKHQLEVLKDHRSMSSNIKEDMNTRLVPLPGSLLGKGGLGSW